MPRRTSFAEVSRNVTKKKPEQTKRVGATPPEKRKKYSTKDQSKPGNTQFSCLEDLQEKDAERFESATVSTTRDVQSTNTDGDETRTDPATAECVVLMEDDECGETLLEKSQDDNDDAEEEEARDKQTESEMNRKLGKAKRLSKKQLRLLQEAKQEEERERAERRKRREERKRKRELQAKLAEEEVPRSFDAAAFKKSVYTMVQSSLDLVMPQGEITITVDNLPPLLKGLDLDTGDGDIKDLILDALLNSYGLIDPNTLDQLVLKKKLQDDLEQLENSVDGAFEVLDQDGDGLITSRDVYRLMIHLGEVLWDDQVEAMVQAADMDGDGKISKKDLFLFLIGREKSIKLEDQILNQHTHTITVEDDLKPSATDPNSSGFYESAPEQNSGSFTLSPLQASLNANHAAQTSPTTSKLTVTAARSSEDLQAAERRRRIFSGYSKSADTSPRLPDPSSLQSKETLNPEDVPDLPLPREDEDINLKSAGSETVEVADATNLKDLEAEKKERATEKDVDILSATPDILNHVDTNVSITGDAADPKHILADADSGTQFNSSAETNNKQGLGTTVRNNPQEGRQAISINIENSDWLDSSHVSCEADGALPDHQDGGEEQSCTPLALERGVSLLPPPEFEPPPSFPLSPHPPSSGLPNLTLSPRSRRQHLASNAGRPESPLQDVVSTKRQDAQHAFKLDLDRQVTSDLHPDHTDNKPFKNQHQDSSPEKDNDSSSETSEHNSLLKNLEEQVLQTKHALEAKTARPPEAGGREKVLFMIGDDDDDDDDGRESVVESIIYPVYVPPCAREARSGLRLPSIEAKHDHSGWRQSAENVSTASLGLSLPTSKDSLADADLEDEEYDFSFGDVVYKSPISLGSPGSMSTMTFTLDVSDHVSSLDGDDLSPRVSPEVSDDLVSKMDHKDVLNRDEELQAKVLKEKNAGIADEPQATGPRSEAHRDAASRIKAARDGSRKLTSRQPQQQSPLRHSLTCHLVTLKELSPSAPTSPSLSPRDPNRLKRGLSSPRLRTFSPCRRDPSLNRREPPPATKKEPGCSTLELVLPEPSSPKPWQRIPPRRAASLNRTSSPAARDESLRFYSPSARGMDSFRTPRLDSPPTHRRRLDTSRSPSSPSRHCSRLESAGRGQHFSRRQKEAWGQPQYDHKESSPLARSGVSSNRSPGGGTHRPLSQDADGGQQKKEKERFYGPNFEVIMSQKGEPEDLLQKSLFPDSPRSKGTQQPPLDNQSCVRTDPGSPVAEGGRRVLISRQLQRVKEMEIRITQRRQNMEGNDNGDLMKNSADSPSGLRRSRTATNMASGSLTDLDQNVSQDPGSSAEGPRHRIRHSSCSSLRTTRSMTNSDSVTENELRVPEVSKAIQSSRSRTVVSKHSPQRGNRPQEKEPVVNIINMEPLLHDDNSPEDSQGHPEEPEKRRRKSLFKPLASMLLLYEKARRRQTALAGTKGNPAVTATSISRQLQQGIPYRPPTPPQHSSSVLLTSNPRKGPEPFQDRFEDCNYLRTPLESSPKNSPSRNVSFVLSSDKEASPQAQSRMTKHDLLFEDEMRHTHDLLTETLTSLRAQRNMTPSVTFEFPERSVCVVKPKPKNTE